MFTFKALCRGGIVLNVLQLNSHLLHSCVMKSTVFSSVQDYTALSKQHNYCSATRNSTLNTLQTAPCIDNNDSHLPWLTNVTFHLKLSLYCCTVTTLHPFVHSHKQHCTFNNLRKILMPVSVRFSFCNVISILTFKII